MRPEVGGRVGDRPVALANVAANRHNDSRHGNGKEGRRVKVYQREKRFRTAGGLEVTDITDDVAAAVQESGVSDGIVCVYSPHTTCCIRVNEFEQGFLEDFSELLRRLCPPDNYYAHDDWDRRTENICP